MQDLAEATQAPSGEPPSPEYLQYAVEAAAAGEATEAVLAMLEANRLAWIAMLERLLDDTEDTLARLRNLQGPERDQVVADFEEERQRLAVAFDRLTGSNRARAASHQAAVDGPDDSVPPGEVQLQASWSNGVLVAWAAGPGTPAAEEEELATRLEEAGAPASGWVEHEPVTLPAGVTATARAIPVDEALGWLVAAGAGQGDGVGPSVTWLGRVAVWAVRLVAKGAIVPTLASRRPQTGKPDARSPMPEHCVRWAPALMDESVLREFARTMPPPVGALVRSDARAVTLGVVGAIVDAVATEAASRLELPAPPPSPRTPAAVAEAFLTRLDGSPFTAPAGSVTELAKRIERWARPVASPVNARLVVQLDPPDEGGAWYLSVFGPDPDGNLVPVEVALVDGKSRQHLAEEWERLLRLLPVLQRPGRLRRGEVILSGDEAWQLMSETGPALDDAGFIVRVPRLSRRRVAPSLRLIADASDPSVVGAHQLADVRWSAVFGDVELTAADIARLAAEAKPLVRSRGRWVRLDHADLAEAAAALAERSSKTKLTGAEVLRYAIGLDGSPLAGGLTVNGTGWAADLLAKAEAIGTEAVPTPDGFVGALRSYQSEALGWIGFLDSVGLGGCLALDMGLGKTPTVLAHLVGSGSGGPALVIAPPAVVGNWAAEAARFTPSLRVVVHHGASRASAEELEAEVAGADVLITTYGTAVRDVEALSERSWDRLILDEAQAIKNPASDTAQQLRRIPARLKLVLTGTPIENGLGDLWSLLDFTNPGLVGTRSQFVAQLSADREGGGGAAAERALRALNGILVFRRTKSEPAVAEELPERIDELDHCTMTPEQIGLYQAVLDRLVASATDDHGVDRRRGAILAAITALKQICNHPANYQDDGKPLAGRSGKLTRLEEIVDAVFAAGERVLVFTHFAEWGKKLADHLTERTGVPIACYHGGLARNARDKIIEEFQTGEGPGALVLSLKAGGTGLNLTAAAHVVLYDRWWNPAVEDQARDRAWRIGQTRTVVSHRLVCPGTVDERVEEVVAGKRHIADLVLPKSSTLADLDSSQLRVALGLRTEELLVEESGGPTGAEVEAA